jgi:hypothetical protein
MIDTLKYDYIELTLPNIVGRWDKNRERCEIRVGRMVKPFVEALAIKYPQWQFVSASFWYRDAYAEAPSFHVNDGREELGTIGADYGRNREEVFVIRNERIADTRTRGDTIETKDLNKAVKIVGKMFRAKTINERLAEANNDADNIIEHVFYDRRSNFQHTYDQVTAHLLPYIMANYETLTPIVIAGGASAETVGRLVSAHDEFKITEEIYKCQRSQDGAVVLIHGNDYAVLGKDDTGEHKTRIFSTETLPPHIKRSVGMLKLVEPKYFLKRVGLKIHDQAFFVVKEVSDE